MDCELLPFLIFLVRLGYIDYVYMYILSKFIKNILMGLKIWFQIWGWGHVFQVKHVHVTFLIFYVKSLIFSFHKHPTMSLLV